MLEVLWVGCFVDPVHHLKVVVTVADTTAGATTPAHRRPGGRMRDGDTFLWHYSPYDRHLLQQKVFALVAHMNCTLAQAMLSIVEKFNTTRLPDELH